MLQSVLGLGSVDIRPQRRPGVLAGICPSGRFAYHSTSPEAKRDIGTDQVRGGQTGDSDQCQGSGPHWKAFFPAMLNTMHWSERPTKGAAEEVTRVM